MNATPEKSTARRTIFDLLAEDGIQAQHASGDEFHSPCPQCGGRDRFSSFPNKPNQDGRYMGGRFVCRQCHFHGDAATYLMERRGMNFPDACATLGLDPGTKPAPITTWCPTKPVAAPATIWTERAHTFLSVCQTVLRANQGAMGWLLEQRGLTPETAESAGLGLNAKDMYFDRAEWGLPPATNPKTGKAKRVWLPAGLVIPCFDGDGRVIRLRIRRNSPGDGQRYIVATGSCMTPVIVWGDQSTVVVVESELDALLIHQEAGDLVGVVAMGSAQAKPDENLHQRLMAAKCILVALDTDEAGKMAAWGFWRQYPAFRRWPCIHGAKDPNEQRLNGIPIRGWIQAALLPEPDDHHNDDHFTDVYIYQGAPTPAAIDLADLMLNYIADQQRPCTEAEIVEAVGGDAVMARNILNRLAVDGVAEALPGGMFGIPPYPPRPADLPKGCPLRVGAPIPKGCRFEARLFQRMIAEGTLPLPGGRCPLRALCKLAGGG